MSTALYRKYRSATFADLIGQDHVVTTLLNQVRHNSVAHAYLFAGVRGTGKTSTARILARAVNCTNLADGEPCNDCLACRSITASASVDVLEIDAASNRGIEEMRDLRDKVKYLPASLRRKVYIIDEAHMLTNEAWNAFLKTLEEPPSHVLFVLATTEPHRVPETVRSRVQRFDFRRVALAALEHHLRTVAAHEGSHPEDAALAVIAQAAQGSVRDALSLLDQALALRDANLTVAAARRTLGLADPELLRDFVFALAGTDPAGAMRAISAMCERGADVRQILREAGQIARGAELCAIGYGEGVDTTFQDRTVCQELGAVAAPGFWLRVLEQFAATETQLRQPIDARLQLELCALGLTAEPFETIAGLVARVGHLEEVVERQQAGVEARVVAPPPRNVDAIRSADNVSTGVHAPASADNVSRGLHAPASAKREGKVSSGGPSHEEMTPMEPPAHAPPHGELPARPAGVLDPEEWRQRWPLLVEAVNRRDAMLAGVLRDCQPLDADAGSLTVGAPYAFHLDRLNDPVKARILVAAASEIAGSPRLVAAIFAGKESAKPAATQSADDATRAVLETFQGSRIVASRARSPE